MIGAELRRGARERRISAASFVALLALAAPNMACAAQDQTTFAVTASVVAACAVSATNMLFGSYDPTSATPNDKQSTVNVTCTNGVSYAIGLDAGGGSGATVAARKMSASTDLLTYSLYTDSGRMTVWGNTANVDVVSSTGTGVLQAFTVYGRAPAAQTAPVGNYTDTVTVTVTF